MKRQTINKNPAMEDTVLQYQILEPVHENDGNVTQRHISRKLGRSIASVNFALRLLAVKGYIKISGANLRNIRYHLTPSGCCKNPSWPTIFSNVRAPCTKK
jgi:predicted transcriptional regulator